MFFGTIHKFSCIRDLRIFDVTFSSVHNLPFLIDTFYEKMYYPYNLIVLSSVSSD